MVEPPAAEPVAAPEAGPVTAPQADGEAIPRDQPSPEPKPAVDPQLLMEAQTLFSQSQDNEAAAICEKILIQDPSNTEALELKNAAYLRLANG